MASGKSGKTAAAPFVTALADIVTSGPPDIVGWTPSGTSFVIHDPDTFSSQILEARFKSSNFTSFVRQLNFYGFRKASRGRDKTVYDFQHPHFLRGHPELLHLIRRKTTTGHEDGAGGSGGGGPEAEAARAEAGELRAQLEATQAALAALRAAWAQARDTLRANALPLPDYADTASDEEAQGSSEVHAHAHSEQEPAQHPTRFSARRAASKSAGSALEVTRTTATEDANEQGQGQGRAASSFGRPLRPSQRAAKRPRLGEALPGPVAVAVAANDQEAGTAEVDVDMGDAPAPVPADKVTSEASTNNTNNNKAEGGGLPPVDYDLLRRVLAASVARAGGVGAAAAAAGRPPSVYRRRGNSGSGSGTTDGIESPRGGNGSGASTRRGSLLAGPGAGGAVATSAAARRLAIGRGRSTLNQALAAPLEAATATAPAVVSNEYALPPDLFDDLLMSDELSNLTVRVPSPGAGVGDAHRIPHPQPHPLAGTFRSSRDDFEIGLPPAAMSDVYFPPMPMPMPMSESDDGDLTPQLGADLTLGLRLGAANPDFTFAAAGGDAPSSSTGAPGPTSGVELLASPIFSMPNAAAPTAALVPVSKAALTSVYSFSSTDFVSAPAGDAAAVPASSALSISTGRASVLSSSLMSDAEDAGNATRLEAACASPVSTHAHNQHLSWPSAPSPASARAPAPASPMRSVVDASNGVQSVPVAEVNSMLSASAAAPEPLRDVKQAVGQLPSIEQQAAVLLLLASIQAHRANIPVADLVPNQATAANTSSSWTVVKPEEMLAVLASLPHVRAFLTQLGLLANVTALATRVTTASATALTMLQQAVINKPYLSSLLATAAVR